MPPARATVLGAFVEGWRRVLGAPWITAGLFVGVLLLSVHSSLTNVIGWLFVHEAFAFGGRTVNLLASVVREEPVILLTSAVFALSVTSHLWLFLSGGILDRFARARPIGTAAFFAASGVYFVRFLRLGIGLGLLYWILFEWVYPHVIVALFQRWASGLTLDEAPGLRMTMIAVVLLLVVAVGIVSDYAKVRSVVEDRHSMIGAVAASLRFVRRRLVRVLLLYALNAGVMLAIMTISLLWRFEWPLVADLFVTSLLLIWARLAFMASSVVFFQGELAHANYTAAPLPVWPDSPAAEAMENLTRSS